MPDPTKPPVDPRAESLFQALFGEEIPFRPVHHSFRCLPIIPVTGPAVGIPDRRKEDLLVRMAKTLNVGDTVNLKDPATPVCCGTQMTWQPSASQWHCSKCKLSRATRTDAPARALATVLPFRRKL